MPAKRPSLKIEDFNYLPESDLPRLVLGIHHHHSDFRSEWPLQDYHFKPGRKWQKIAHQTAGHGCNQHYWIGTILKPKQAVFEGIVKIEKKWLDSQFGVFGQTIDGILEYRNDVKTLLDADCNHSFDLFQEAQYPIDAEFAQKLTDEKLPADFDEWIKWESGMMRACGCIGRWKLAILGTNSD